jgi:hypothetical protein
MDIANSREDAVAASRAGDLYIYNLAANGSMVDRRLREFQSLVRRVGTGAGLAVVLTIAACVPVSGPAALPVAPAAVVAIAPDAAAARIEGTRLEVLIAPAGGASIRAITSSYATRGRTSVNLLSYGGETGDEWNTFVYGTAVPGAARVDLDWPGGVGGAVVDGAWLVVPPDKDVRPDDLTWRFLDAGGTELVRGDGIVTLYP